MKRGLKFLLLIALFSNLFFVSAQVSVSPTSVTAEINEVEAFSITVTNDYTDGVAPNNGTITQIAFSLPNGLLFSSGSNSANPTSTFSNTSSILTWTNSSYVVNLAGQTVFTFSANASSLGSSSITITSTFANSSTTTNTISITTNDTESPTVVQNSPANNNDDTDGVLVFDCSFTDNYDLDSIALYIWDNSSAQVYSSILGASGVSNQTEFDYTFSSDGEYDWNCFANDTARNSDWGSNRTITISAGLTSCSTDWDCEEWTSCADGLQTRTCNDLNSCGTNSSKPSESQTCDVVCTAEWDCTDWAPLQCPESEQQTRTCVDVNSCDSEAGKPTETRVCTFEKSGSGIFVFVIVGVLIIGVGAGAFFFLKNRTPSIPSTGNTLNPTYTANYGNNNSGNNGQEFTYKYS